MSKRTKIIISIFVLTLVISLWAFNVALNITKSIKIKPGYGGDKAIITELVITETQDGKKFWEVYAESAKYSNENKLATLKNLQGNFYKNGKVVLSFAAPLAAYNNSKKEIILSGGAKAATLNGIIVSSYELRWGNHMSNIYARGDVKIIKPNEFVIKGDESIFTADFSEFKMVGKSQSDVYAK